PSLLAIVRVHPLKDAPSHPPLGRVAEHPRHGWADVLDGAVGIEQPNGIRTVLDQSPEPLIALAHRCFCLPPGRDIARGDDEPFGASLIGAERELYGSNDVLAGLPKQSPLPADSSMVGKHGLDGGARLGKVVRVNAIEE